MRARRKVTLSFLCLSFAGILEVTYAGLNEHLAVERILPVHLAAPTTEAGVVTVGQSKYADGRTPVTVAESIRMTRLGNEDYFSGDSSKGHVAQFSPDGKHFVISLRKGNLERNTNEYSLLLFQTADALRSPKPDLLLTMSSASNQAAIGDIKWMSDNETICFLGEQEGETAQVYTFNIRARKFRKLTRHPTSVSAYDVTTDGREVLYLAHPPPRSGINSGQARRDGIAITTQHLYDIFAGESGPSWSGAREQLFLQKPNRSTVPIPIKDYFYPESNFVLLSPGGRYALVRSWAGGDAPKFWSEYERKPVGLMRFLLLDTKDGLVAPLLNTPMNWFNETAAWSADGQSIYLTTRLPLDAADSGENEERKKRFYDVEVRLPNKEIRKINTIDYETVRAQELEKRERVNANIAMDVVLEEDVNTPPKIYVSDTKTHERALLLDLNPQFVGLEFGKVETIDWKAADIEFIGGLYLPPDYSPGKRYPLVIQTHGFSTDRFSMDGENEWSSSYAARPLAAEGFVVLQTYNLKNEKDREGISGGTDKRFGVTPEQSFRRLAMLAYEGAIDYLAGRGIIDRNRVGISGFSRTVSDVAYALTHSNYPFGAAVMTDGVGGGYFEDLAFFPDDPSDSNDMNGGVAPFGTGIESWLKESPSFNLDKVKTPVRLVALGPESVLEMWEWFSGLSLQKKPVDFIEIPDGAHLLQKPWERRTAMEGIVDWFRFWLEAEEDPDPAKTDQYGRWRELGKLQKQNEAKPQAALPN